ncbi:MAG: hypothetical protein AAFQ54_09005 [Pseudomonadota bacterium]
MADRKNGQGAFGPVGRWSIVILAGLVLYFAAEYAADAAGWEETAGRTVAIGAMVGLVVGGLAGRFGLIGGDDDGDDSDGSAGGGENKRP